MLLQTFTITQFIANFKLGRTRTYEEIKSGRLATYKVGRNRYISGHAAEEWQRGLELETAQHSAVPESSTSVSLSTDRDKPPTVMVARKERPRRRDPSLDTPLASRTRFNGATK